VLDFKRDRPIGYKGYKCIGQLPASIPGAQYVLAYEYQFDVGDNYFTALSLLVQEGLSMLNTTASACARDFEKHRRMIERIVFSFRLIGHHQPG
jgi:hypothetical protein